MEHILKYFKELTSNQIEQFKALAPLYESWNSKINVISRKDIPNLYLHHVLHSLSIVKYLQHSKLEEEFERGIIMDVGTGGGFPGIPLAIYYPNATFVLADSIGKKITVAEAISKEIGLQNVITVNGRAEQIQLHKLLSSRLQSGSCESCAEAAKQSRAEQSRAAKQAAATRQFNFIVSRAVTSLDNFIPWVKGKYTNSILYLKGGDTIAQEIQAAATKNRFSPTIVEAKDIIRWLPEPFFEGKKLLRILSF